MAKLLLLFIFALNLCSLINCKCDCDLTADAQTLVKCLIKNSATAEACFNNGAADATLPLNSKAELHVASCSKSTIGATPDLGKDGDQVKGLLGSFVDTVSDKVSEVSPQSKSKAVCCSNTGTYNFVKQMIKSMKTLWTSTDPETDITHIVIQLDTSKSMSTFDTMIKAITLDMKATVQIEPFNLLTPGAKIVKENYFADNNMAYFINTNFKVMGHTAGVFARQINDAVWLGCAIPYHPKKSLKEKENQCCLAWIAMKFVAENKQTCFMDVK